MVVLACNPCPCGDYSADARLNRCTCREVQRRDYRNKVTGPVADRIDIVRHLAPLRPHDRGDRLDVARVVRRRSGRGWSAARARQAERYAGESWRLNGHAPGPVLRERWPLSERRPSGWSTTRSTPAGSAAAAPPGCTGSPGRSPTCAASTGPGVDEVDIALRLRTGDPLLLGDAGAGRMSAARRRPAGPGRAGRGSPSPATRGSPTWSPSSAPSRCTTRLLGRARPRRPAHRRRPPGSRDVDPERELARAARLGLRFVVPGDAEWPRRLDDLRAAPSRCRSAAGVPLGLWVRGPLRLDELAGSVAVVGSRSATTYGADVAAELAAAVGQAGLARSCPARRSASTRRPTGARSPAAAPTVAVLACGADRAYPAAHRQLLDHLAAEGAVVSETAARAGAPTRLRFLSRNRLIAALTRGTVVVEAALRSGALNTANWAGRLNRPLMGVPGPVTSAPSQGVHQLIRTGAATLVTSGEDVLELVGAAGEHLRRGAARARTGPRPAQPLRQQQVLDAVPVAAAARSDSIARTAGLGLRRGARRRWPGCEARGLVEADERRLAARRAALTTERRSALPRLGA